MPSCLLCDHPAGKQTHTPWVHCQKQSLQSSLAVGWALLLTVAKVEWNKRFSKRFPSAKVSSKASVTQEEQVSQNKLIQFYTVWNIQDFTQTSHTCVNSLFSHRRDQFGVGCNFFPTFNSFRHQLVHRINFTHQTWGARSEWCIISHL